MSIVDSALGGAIRKIAEEDASSARKASGLNDNSSLLEVIRLLLGVPSARKKNTLEVSDDEIKRTDDSYYEMHSKDVNMPEGMEYIPTPAYNSNIDSVIRLLNARSKGTGQIRRA